MASPLYFFETLCAADNGGTWYVSKVNLTFRLGHTHTPTCRLLSDRFNFSSLAKLSTENPSIMPREYFGLKLPSADMQRLLINVYFVYVHPVLPILSKRALMSVNADRSVQSNIFDN